MYSRKTDKVMQEHYTGPIGFRIGFVKKDGLGFSLLTHLRAGSSRLQRSGFSGKNEKLRTTV